MLDFYNIDGILFELRYYSDIDEKTGKYIIPILVDFDFTITKESSWEDNTFTPNEHCLDTMLKWQNEYGVRFILDTMRGDDNVGQAVEFLESNGIRLLGVGDNPMQAKGDECTKKIWAIMSIDDRNIGTPLIHESGKRAYVDWEEVDEIYSPLIKKISNEIN